MILIELTTWFELGVGMMPSLSSLPIEWHWRSRRERPERYQVAQVSLMELREERGMPKLCQEYGISDGEHAEMPFQHV